MRRLSSSCPEGRLIAALSHPPSTWARPWAGQGIGSPPGSPDGDRRSPAGGASTGGRRCIRADRRSPHASSWVLAVLMMRARLLTANHGDMRCGRRRSCLLRPLDPHLRPGRWGGRWQSSAHVRRRVTRFRLPARRMILALALSPALAAAVASCSSRNSSSAPHTASAAPSTASASAASTAAAVAQIKANWEAFFSGTTAAVAAGCTAFGDRPGRRDVAARRAGARRRAGCVHRPALAPRRDLDLPLMPGDRETGQP